MLQTSYIHNRSASPTLRTPGAGERIDAQSKDLVDTGSVATRQRLPSGLSELPKFQKVVNGVIYKRIPGESFTTVSWPADARALDLEHPHSVLDCGMSCNVNVSKDAMESLEYYFEGSPLMHCSQQASRTLSQGNDGKNIWDAAHQTFRNVEQTCTNLESKFNVFSADVKVLSHPVISQQRARQSADSSPRRVALLRIMQSVWPDMKFKSINERETWIARTLRDPKPFIAQTYDALDVALGTIAIKILEAKETAYNHGASKSQVEKESMLAGMNVADDAYTRVRGCFLDHDLPVEDSVLKGHSVVAYLRRETDADTIMDIDREAAQRINNEAPHAQPTCCVIS